MRLDRRAFLVLLSGLLLEPQLCHAADLSDAAQRSALLKRIDDARMNLGDLKSLLHIEHVRRDKPTLTYEMLLYRRDAEERMVLLINAPKTEAGKAYLKIKNSAFVYDPTLGDWERRTERDSIAGTSAKRSDFDRSRYASDYVSEYVGAEQIQKFPVHHLKLVAKSGAATHAAVLHLWIDRERGVLLKQQDFAASGKLLRTLYFPAWNTAASTDGRSIAVPRQLIIYDEVEKGTRTTVVTRAIDLAPLGANIFTKAWVEGRSR
jgi:hypothetical protein